MVANVSPQSVRSRGDQTSLLVYVGVTYTKCTCKGVYLVVCVGLVALVGFKILSQIIFPRL